MNKAHHESFEGYKITIYYDDDDQLNPRTFQDNTSIMLCKHDRYCLGDEKQPTFDSLSEILEHIESLNPLAIKSLYLYDHSGITISTGSFSCPWDSGQIGYAYVTKESMIRMGFKDEHMTSEFAQKIIDEEVKEYDHYLRGEVYSYDITGPGLNDSCGGYIGDMDYCLEDARQEIRRHIEAVKDAVDKINDDQWSALATKCMRSVCSYCDESFENETLFIQHMKQYHADKVLEELSEANP